jgi:hypothetical protein
MKQAITAVRSFHNPAEQPRRKSQCERILDFLREMGRAMTLGEIAKAIGVPDSTASARLNALKKRNEVDIFLDRKCSVSGNTRQTWYLSPKPGAQRSLFGGAGR